MILDWPEAKSEPVGSVARLTMNYQRRLDASDVRLKHFLGCSDSPSTVGLGVDLRYADFAVP